MKKETLRVGAWTGIGCAAMLLVFFLLHTAKIFGNVPFGISEVISGILGWLVASLNFFLMAVTVQKVAGMTDQDQAKKAMTASYRWRMILQLGWAVLSFVIPFLNPAAGIIPLFIPSIVIKLMGIRGKKAPGAAPGTEAEDKNP